MASLRATSALTRRSMALRKTSQTKVTHAKPALNGSLAYRCERKFLEPQVAIFSVY